MKFWDDDNNMDGIRAAYEVTLYANGEPATVEDAIVTLQKDQLEYVWENLLKNKLGEPIVYTVVESKIPSGYSASVTDEELKTVITNHHKPELPKTGDNNGPLAAGMGLLAILSGAVAILTRRRA